MASFLAPLAQSTKFNGNLARPHSFDGMQLEWRRCGNARFELLTRTGLPLAIFHPSGPARLELTGFPWARMPSDELECDYDGCGLRPLFGFNFRCQDVSKCRG